MLLSLTGCQDLGVNLLLPLAFLTLAARKEHFTTWGILNLSYICQMFFYELLTKTHFKKITRQADMKKVPLCSPGRD